MKIVMAAAECVPFVKAGGLADVLGALPKALVEIGCEVTVILPKYSLIPQEYQKEFVLSEEVEVPFKGSSHLCRTFSYQLKGVDYIFVEHDGYFDRDMIYRQSDDHTRFAFFSRAVLAVVEAQRAQTNILHLHDWHTALIPFLLEKDPRYATINAKLKTILTIHNLQFQGNAPKSVLTEEYEMDEAYYEDGTAEWKGRFNILKTGILFADQVTTVSPTYRDEILTAQYGEGLEALLQEKGDSLIGVLNGLDIEFYNPATDLAIEMEYDQNSLERKVVNKRAVQKKFNLPDRGDIPLLTVVSRLTNQKGMDVLQDLLPNLLKEKDVQFILLGSGDEKISQFFTDLATEFPEKAASYIGFDEDLAHLLYAGADLFLMPSHFEPCGLSQLISMRYGTVPVANKTGGLKDTVVEYNVEAQTGNGFLSDFSANESFEDALARALSLYENHEHWGIIKRNGMQLDSSWKRSAEMYAEAYKAIAER